MSGDRSTTFRSRDSDVDEALNRLEQDLLQRTSSRKTSLNQVLNFAVLLADDQLDKVHQEMKKKENELQELEEELDKLKSHMKELTDF